MYINLKKFYLKIWYNTTKMSITTTKYSINQIKQIIPLNENIVNFELNFEIKSENNLPFKAVVLSDDELNSENPINYQEVKNGIINGNIVNDKGVYQLYYLLLKAEQPVDCDITLDIKEVSLNQEIQEEQINQERENTLNIQREQQRQQQLKQQMELQFGQREIERKKKEEQKNLQERQQKENEIKEKSKRQLIKKAQDKEESKSKWIITFVIFGGIVALGLWFLFFNKKNKTKLNAIQETILQKVEMQPLKVQDIESILKIEPEIPKLDIRPEIPSPKLDIRPELPKLDIRPELPKLDIIPEASKFEAPKVDGISRRNNNLLSRLNNYFDN